MDLLDVQLVPGKYIVAVSGGVDSVVLLHLLAGRPELQLVVAHFNHGIRPDADQDARLVAALAAQYGLAFTLGQAQLGPGASEAAARQARYQFLFAHLQQQQAQAIVTAHHQDDLLETVALNVLRGTGRRGLTPLKSRPEIIRPLLATPKSSLYDYAREHQLEWREDSTNSDQKYRRNFVRANLPAHHKQALQQIIERSSLINAEIDQILEVVTARNWLDRRWFIGLPHDVSRELMASWLRRQSHADFSRQTIERLVVASKTLPAGKQLDVIAGWRLVLGKTRLALEAPERYNGKTYG